MQRIRPGGTKVTKWGTKVTKSGNVHQLKPPRGLVLSVEDQQTIARRRAQVDLPTEQRDFLELWGKERQPKRKRKA